MAIAVEPAVRPQRQVSGALLITFVVSLTIVQSLYAALYAYSPWLRAHSLVQLAERLATWTLPAVIILSKTTPDVLDALRMRRRVLRGVAWGLLIGAAIVVPNVLGTWLLKGHVHIDMAFDTGVWWRGVILVGFSEEVVYRGFLLPHFERRMTFWGANRLQAALFLLIHLPGWLFLGQFAFPGIIRLAGFVFLFGLFLGYIWKRTDSLWACMLVHSFNNFASFAIS